MTEKEFKKLASEYGYDEEEINDLIDFAKEANIPLDKLTLIEKIVD